MEVCAWNRRHLSTTYYGPKTTPGFEEYQAFQQEDILPAVYLSHFRDSETHRQEYRLAQYLFPLVRQPLKAAIVKRLIKQQLYILLITIGS